MADGGPVDAGERGTSPDDRGTSAAPLRNTAAPDADMLLAPSTAAAKKRAVDANLPKLDDGFAANFEKQKITYADAEAASYDPGTTDGSPDRAATVRKIVADVRERITKQLAGLTGEDLISSATALANRWIAVAFDQLKKPATEASPCVLAAFEKHFAAKSREEIVSATAEIRAMLTELRDGALGINSTEVTYECGGWCYGNPAETGNVRSSITTLCDAVWSSVFDDYCGSPRKYNALALVLLHEGLHRTSWWRFKHTTGETYVGTPEYAALNLKGHIAEADSYAYFAQAIAACDDV